jgi:hypothetical protein
VTRAGAASAVFANALMVTTLRAATPTKTSHDQCDEWLHMIPSWLLPTTSENSAFRLLSILFLISHYVVN